MLRVLELFAGIGACSKALTNLGIEHEIVDAVEIDKYAIKSFNAIHGTNFEPQDITTWDKDVECDLIMHGSPCQDFSVAGRGAGGDKDSGTRSSLMYETLRIVEKVKPKVVIWENVKNLLSKKHRHNFDAYVKAMYDMGYNSYWQVLNAKDYGVPQNRERVFTISLAAGWPGEFTFPPKQELTKRLKDVLENNVDEKYYLSDKQVASFKASTERAKAKGNGFKFEPIERERESNAHHRDSGGATPDRQLYQGIIGRVEAIKGHDQIKRVYGTDGCAPTISTMQGGNREPKIAASRGRNPMNPSDRSLGAPTVQRLEFNKNGTTNTITSVAKDNYVCEPTGGVPIRTANKRGYDMAINGDGIDLGYPQSNTRRGRVGHGVAKTIPTSDSQGTLDGFRIRKLTPRECWRLMGFSDEDFDKAKAAGISDTQLYKQAGNSIVVDVLMAIFRSLYGKTQ